MNQSMSSERNRFHYTGIIMAVKRLMHYFIYIRVERSEGSTSLLEHFTWFGISVSLTS